MVRLTIAWLAVGLNLTAAVPLVAQTQPTVYHVEVSGGLVLSGIKTVAETCCELRGRPTIAETGFTSATVSVGAEVRVYETRQASLVFRAESGRAGDVALASYDHMMETPPFTTYTVSPSIATRTSTFALSQTFDLRGDPRGRPWFGVGVVLSKLSWNQRLVLSGLSNPTFPTDTTGAHVFWRKGVIVNAGVRAYLKSRFFIGPEVGVTVLSGKKGADPNTGNWAVSRAAWPYARVGVGLAF
jgi:hypothetical protein